MKRYTTALLVLLIATGARLYAQDSLAFPVPVSTTMYKVDPIDGKSYETPVDTKMYQVKSIHD